MFNSVTLVMLITCSDLKRNGRPLFIVDAGRVLHDDGHLGFVEHRLRNYSQHPARPDQPQLKFSICSLHLECERCETGLKISNVAAHKERENEVDET